MGDDYSGGHGATMNDDLPAVVSLYFDTLGSTSSEKRGVVGIFNFLKATVG
jgi:hypothetical protein